LIANSSQVEVTAGAAPFINNKSYLAAAAGIRSVKVYHADLIRTFLFAGRARR
jgi:hypothetical protein